MAFCSSRILENPSFSNNMLCWLEHQVHKRWLFQILSWRTDSKWRFFPPRCQGRVLYHGLYQEDGRNNFVYTFFRTICIHHMICPLLTCWNITHQLGVSNILEWSDPSHFLNLFSLCWNHFRKEFFRFYTCVSYLFLS